MIWGKQQSEEIKTIHGRSIEIRLSDADVERIAEKAAAGGLTVAELLQNFIGDLVDGTYSNGSDERMYAEQWYDRCHFGGYGPTSSLLQHLTRNCDLDRFLEVRELITNSEDDLLDEDLTEEERQEMQQYINDLQTEMTELCGEYTDPDDLKKVLSWKEEMDKMMLPSKMIDSAKRSIYFRAGGPFDVDSPSALAKVLFEDLGLPPVKKTEEGYSVDDEVLEKLKGQHSIVEAILEYRQLVNVK